MTAMWVKEFSQHYNLLSYYRYANLELHSKFA